MKKPKKPASIRGFYPHSKPFKPYKPKEFFEQDTIVENFRKDGYFTLSNEDLRRYADAGCSLCFESTASEYYGSYEVETDVVVKSGTKKVRNPNYDEQLEQYKKDYAQYKEEYAEWKRKKAIYDEWVAECEKVQEINKLKQLQAKYGTDPG